MGVRHAAMSERLAAYVAGLRVPSGASRGRADPGATLAASRAEAVRLRWRRGRVYLSVGAFVAASRAARNARSVAVRSDKAIPSVAVPPLFGRIRFRGLRPCLPGVGHALPRQPGLSRVKGEPAPLVAVPPGGQPRAPPGGAVVGLGGHDQPLVIGASARQVEHGPGAVMPLSGARDSAGARADPGARSFLACFVSCATISTPAPTRAASSVTPNRNARTAAPSLGLIPAAATLAGSITTSPAPKSATASHHGRQNAEGPESRRSGSASHNGAAPRARRTCAHASGAAYQVNRWASLGPESS